MFTCMDIASLINESAIALIHIYIEICLWRYLAVEQILVGCMGLKIVVSFSRWIVSVFVSRCPYVTYYQT
jgi:hypothetical protein